MAELVSAVLGTSIGGALAALWLIGILLYGTLPIMALVATLNLRKIRVQLERLNNTLEVRPGAPS